MLNAWALLVVSSEAQAETLTYQRSWAEGACTDRKWNLTRVVDGVASGKDGPRRLSQDVLLEIRATPVEARPQYLLMTRLDRVGRGSIVDSQIFVRDLFILGVRVVTRDQGEVRLDSAMDELIAAVQMAVARHENDVRRDKMRAVFRRRVDAGQVVSNRAPYGLHITADRRMEVLPTHANILREIFLRRIAGVRVVDIMRWLQDNAPPQTFDKAEPYFVRWTDSRVALLISNRSYAGTAVDEATWLRAQRTSLYAGRAMKRVRKHGVFPLGGFIRCVCGRGLSATARNAKKRAKRGLPPNRSYACRATWNHDGRWVYHRADDVEVQFISLLAALAVEPGKGRNWARHGSKRERIEREIAAVRASIERIETSRARVWVHEERGHISADEVAVRFETLRLRRQRFELLLLRLMEERTLLDAMRKAAEDVDVLHRTAHERYRAGSTKEQIATARAVIVSLGGLRVGMDGRLVSGTGADCTPQRRRKKGEII